MKKIALFCSLFFYIAHANAQWEYIWFFNQNNNESDIVSYEKNKITVNESESYLSTINKIEKARFYYFSTSDYQINKQNVSFFNLLKNKLLYLNINNNLDIDEKITKEGITMSFDKNSFNMIHVNEYQCNTLINFIKQKRYIQKLKINNIDITKQVKPACKEINEFSWT